jgi:hypothetical protein
MSSKVAGFLNKRFQKYVKDPITVNMKKISKKARSYFFLPKNVTKEIKNKKLTLLLNAVKKEVAPVIKACEEIAESLIKKMPWNFKRTIRQIRKSARQYLKDVRKFLATGVLVSTKRLSFHLQEVACFTKSKLGKKYQFGRAIQLGRIKGNFFFVGKSTSVRMPDKKSLVPMMKEHENIFGKGKIHSISTDKGYYSSKNEKYLAKKNINEIGIQRPYNIKKAHPKPITKACEEKLINRRAGIEPLIGHIKQGGQLGRSRMKSDKTIESSGYTAVLGFNLRQLIRHQKLADESKVA